MPGDLICPDHGLRRHAALHEAGHAYLAMVRGQSFVDVAIAVEPERLGEMLRAGGVTMRAGLPGNWVPDDPEAALDIFLAGVISERHFVGHALGGAIDGDLEQFKHGVERLGMDAEGRVALVPAALARVQRELEVNQSKVKRIADALEAVLVLTEDDVRRLVEDPD